MNTIQVLDKSKLASVAKSSPTAEAIFQDCASRNRIRWETDMSRHSVKLAHKGFKVVPEDYMNTWKELEAAGAGVIIYGRAGNSNRFRWHYSLKDVGQGGLHPEQSGEIAPLTPKKDKPVTNRASKTKSRRGRPPGSKNRSKLLKQAFDKPSVVFTLKAVDGTSVSIGLQEAAKLIEQVSELRKLTA